jgi:hypothetical protein
MVLSPKFASVVLSPLLDVTSSFPRSVVVTEAITKTPALKKTAHKSTTHTFEGLR